MDPPQPAEPTLLVLPVMSGTVRDFEAMPARVREYLRQQDAGAGPWVFDPHEHGTTVWEWVARHGFGDSCRDTRILDEFIELVMVRDPETGEMGAAMWKPSARSMLTTDSRLANRVMSFVSLHLEDVRMVGFSRSPRVKGAPSLANFARNALVRDGAGMQLGLEELAGRAYSQALAVSNRESDPGGALIAFIGGPFEGPPGTLPKPSTSLFVADWLELLLTEHGDHPARGHAPPMTADDLARRMGEILEWVFHADSNESPAFAMTVEALFARVIERTNELRRLYRFYARVWPELPALELPYDTAHVTFAAATPAMARLAAEMGCEHCEGCARVPDVTLHDQLELDLAS
jgi:hypothetical protein